MKAKVAKSRDGKPLKAHVLFPPDVAAGVRQYMALERRTLSNAIIALCDKALKGQNAA